MSVDEKKPHIPIRKPIRPIVKWLLIMSGLLLVAIGFVAIFIPGLPTTPFLLLASYCFIRSSDRLYTWLLNSRFFGPIIEDWHQHRGIRRHVKWRAIMVVLIVFAISLYFTLPRLSWIANIGIILLVLVGIGVILRLPIVKESQLQQRHTE